MALIAITLGSSGFTIGRYESDDREYPPDLTLFPQNWEDGIGSKANPNEISDYPYPGETNDFTLRLSIHRRPTGEVVITDMRVQP